MSVWCVRGTVAAISSVDTRRFRRLTVAAALVALLCGGIDQPVDAAETNGSTSWSGVAGGSTANDTTPSGLVETVTLANGANSVLTVGVTGSPGLAVSGALNARGATAAMFDPNTLAVATTQSVNLAAAPQAGCPNAPANQSVVTCNNMGTMTFTFSQPVRNPTLHITGLGAYNAYSDGTLMRLSTRLSLASSAPAGASLGTVSSGAVNLQQSGGTIETINPNNSTACNNTNDGQPAAATAGCGSVRITGTVTSLTFNVSMKYLLTACPFFGCSATSPVGNIDVFNATFSFPQDFSDAPTSFGVPRHVIGDLTIGSVVDADNTNTENPTTSPFPATAPNDAIGDNTETASANDNEPGNDEEGVTYNGGLTTAMIGSAYTATVRLSGVSKAGETCGWIDFNRNGTFETTERACTTFAVGATSATLTWTVPTATSAGRAYTRVRAAYGAAGGAASVPDGPADSGEVEDYQLDIKPVVRISKALVDPTATPGTFDLQINGTTLASGVGNGGSTGFKTVYVSSRSGLGAANANTANDVSTAANVESASVTVTSAELASAGSVPLIAYNTTVSCVDATGAAATFTAGANNQSISSLTIPQSTTGATANGRAQTITCTYTNTRRLADLTITKNDGVTQVNPGGTTTYTLVVTNNGPTTATGIVLQDSAGAGLTLTSDACAATPGQCTAGTTPTIAQLQAGYALPALASGQTYQISLAANVTAHTGSVTNTATITPPADVANTGTSCPTAQAGNTFTAATGACVSSDTDTMIPANVSIGKTDLSAVYTPGGSATYTITINNTGGAVFGATVSDLLPKGVTLTSPWVCGPAANCVAGCTVSGSNCTGSSPPTPFAGDAATNIFSALQLNLPQNSTTTITVPVSFANSPGPY